MKIFLLILIILAAAALLCFAVTYGLLRVTLRRDDAPDRAGPRALPGGRWNARSAAADATLEWLASQPRTDAGVTADDGTSLRGFWLPAPQARGTVVLVHGYHSCPENDFAGIMEYYSARGFNILAVEQRCHGRSGGRQITFGVKESSDAAVWARYAAAEHPLLPLFLHGVSMGGATVLLSAAGELPPQAAGVVADCAFTTPKRILAYQMTRQYRLPAFPFVPIGTLAGISIMGLGFVSASTPRAAARSPLPILVVHGTEDRSVPVGMAEEIFAAAGRRGSLLLVPGARHGASFLSDSAAYSAALDSFISRCLSSAQE